MEDLGIPLKTLAEYKKRFEADPKNVLAQTVCAKSNIKDLMRTREAETTQHVYNTKVRSEVKPVTNQRASGRCWIFACLNVMRLRVAAALGVDELEFSQTALFFWDKVERCHYLLHGYIRAAREGQPADGRLVQHLLGNPAEDGGQWHMLVNLVEKYGIMPKCAFSCSWTSENSRIMNSVINNKMREFCLRLREDLSSGVGEEALQLRVSDMVEQIYRVVSVCLGTPPDSFTWQYYNKDKVYCRVGPISPQQFYQQYVRPHFNVADKVVLVNDPRPAHPYDALYTVDYLGNMVGGRPTLYINQPVQALKAAALASLRADEAVWFGCDVNQHCSWQRGGVQSLSVHAHELLLGVGVGVLDKAQRLLYRDSLMTHAMVFTAVTTDEQTEETRQWRVENSWGDEAGAKGYIAMSDDWFSEYVFEVVVDRKHVSPALLALIDTQPTVLPAWDPMGALAKHSLTQSAARL